MSLPISVTPCSHSFPLFSPCTCIDYFEYPIHSHVAARGINPSLSLWKGRYLATEPSVGWQKVKIKKKVPSFFGQSLARLI